MNRFISCLLPFIFASLLLHAQNLPNENYLNIRSFYLSYQNNIMNDDILSSGYSLSFNTSFISNEGHSNIDNSEILYSPGSITRFLSARFTASSSWFKLYMEPYSISYSGDFNNELPSLRTYRLNNNHSKANVDKSLIGLRQSGLIIHFNGFGIAYGNFSHWWGPGFHSAITLTNNAQSQLTYAFGTFRDINIRNFSFNSKIIVMPYMSNNNTQLYFSIYVF